MKSLLVEVRKLDAPTDDALLPDIFDILTRRVSDPVWKQGLVDARSHYDRMQTQGPLMVVDPRSGAYVTPREAFELWIYGEHLHNDYDKEQRVLAMDPAHRATVRAVAVGYMDMLVRGAAYGRAVFMNDPAFAPVR